MIAFKVVQNGIAAEKSFHWEQARARYFLACRIYPWRAEYYDKLANSFISLSYLEKDPSLVNQAVNTIKELFLLILGIIIAIKR